MGGSMMKDLRTASAVIEQICTYDSQTKIGKIMLQKLMYLMQRRGLDMKLSYSIHYYGPYSSDLYDLILVKNRLGELEIDTGSRTHVISIGSEAGAGVLDPDDSRIFSDVMGTFFGRTALELEGITTVDYVAHTTLKDSGTREQIIERTKRIKGTKFSDTVLQDDLDLLIETGFVSPCA